MDRHLYYEGEIYTDEGIRIENARIEIHKQAITYEIVVIVAAHTVYECKYADDMKDAEMQFRSLLWQYTILNKPFWM